MPNMQTFLTANQLSELEKLRKEINFPHEDFLRIVLTSPELERKIIEKKYYYAKKTTNKTDQEIFNELLMEDFLSDTDVVENAEKLSEKAKEIVDQIIALGQIISFDQFCDFMTDKTKQKIPDYESGPIDKKITDIISKGT